MTESVLVYDIFLHNNTCVGGTLSYCSNKNTERYGPKNRCAVCKCRPHYIDNVKLKLDNHIKQNCKWKSLI